MSIFGDQIMTSDYCHPILELVILQDWFMLMDVVMALLVTS